MSPCPILLYQNFRCEKAHYGGSYRTYLNTPAPMLDRGPASQQQLKASIGLEFRRNLFQNGGFDIFGELHCFFKCKR
jgi:hypothetical protein